MEEFPYLENQEAIGSYLRGVAGEEGVGLDDERLAVALDKRDKLASFRSKFCVPTIGEIYEGKEIETGQFCQLRLMIQVYNLLYVLHKDRQCLGGTHGLTTITQVLAMLATVVVSVGI